MTPEQIKTIESHISNRRQFAKDAQPEIAREIDLITDAVESMLAEWRDIAALPDYLPDFASCPDPVIETFPATVEFIQGGTTKAVLRLEDGRVFGAHLNEMK